MTERELLSLVYGYKQNEHYCYGRSVIFFTDHEPLVTLNRLRNPLGRIGRLLNNLSDIKYEFRYVRGPENHLADFMSRGEYPDPPPALEANFIEFNPQHDWAIEQGTDKEVAAVKAALLLPMGKDKEASINSLPKSWSKELKNLFVMKDILKHGAGQVAVPEHLRLPLLKWHHDPLLAGHRAYETTVYAMSARYFWPGMKSYILEYCKTCSGCQTFNFKNSTARHPLMPMHYNTCKPFVKWRRQWIDLNVSDIPTNNGSEEELDFSGGRSQPWRSGRGVTNSDIFNVTILLLFTILS